MLITILAYLGGVLTIFSPCVLPVIPFVFARSDQPFRRNGLPILVGMGLSFSAFAAAATVGGNWIVKANQYGRLIAMIILALMGIALLWPAFAERVTRPFVQWGALLQRKTENRETIPTSLLLGASIGLLWAPCAGPILGLVLAGAAIGGANARTLILLLSFAGGAATSLSVALLAGGRVIQSLKRGFGAEEWIRRILGAAVLLGVAAIAFGLDTRFLAKFSYLNTNAWEQSLVSRFNPQTTRSQPSASSEGELPALAGAVQWLNTAPLTREGLRGKVVLIDFWTYSCINCLRSLPYVKAWADKYKDQGLVVIGVHTPEFAFERDTGNVARAVQALGVTYPVAIDSNAAIWTAFRNQYWPAHYLADAQGQIRYHSFGEGDYEQTERMIQTLLAEIPANKQPPPAGFVQVAAGGAQAASQFSDDESPETYIGYARQQGFASPEPVARDAVSHYSLPASPTRNQWGLQGAWRLDSESARLDRAPGDVTYHFHARDLHLVLGTTGGKPVRFRVTLDGGAPGPDHGADVDEKGYGTVTGYRLYQLIRQKGPVKDRTFKIEFLDPDVKAFAFTFG